MHSNNQQEKERLIDILKNFLAIKFNHIDALILTDLLSKNSFSFRSLLVTVINFIKVFYKFILLLIERFYLLLFLRFKTEQFFLKKISKIFLII